MKKLLPIILTVLMLTVFILPINSSAEGAFALKNTSGAVYPSSDLDLALQYTGKDGVCGFEFSELVYDSTKLSFKGGSTTIGNSTLEEKEDGKHGFLFMINNLVGVTGEIFKLDFELKEGAKIGDTLKITLKNLDVSNAEGKPLHSGDLTYTVVVKEKPKNTNCNLHRLSAQEGAFEPAFDADSSNSSYAITVPHTVSALTLTVKTANVLASYEVSGNENFAFGENTVTITVTAESGAQRVYTITVTKLDPPSEDTTLSELTVAEGTLSPAFSADVKDYTVSVGSDIRALTFTVTPADAKASYEIVGNAEFAVGENKVEIIVTAENGNTDKYTVTVTRARPIETSALLSALSFGKYEFDLPFSPTQKQYSVTVAYEEALDGLLAYKTESDYATVVATIPEEYVVGANSVLVTVTAEDGVTVDIYTITVHRAARILSSDATLKQLEVNVEGLSPAFSPDVFIYTLVTVPKCDVVRFGALANDLAATTEQTVEKTVVPGLNTVVLTCTAENGTVLEYTVHIFVPEEKPKPQLILNGVPQVGEKLTLTFVGESEGGSYQWYVGGEPVEGVTADSYLLLSSSANQTVYAKYIDQDGTEVVSQTLTVKAAVDAAKASGDLTTADILIMSIAVVLAFVAGGFVGALFFGKKSKKS